MQIYGVVDEGTEEAVEVFLRRVDAERFVADVAADEPETAVMLHVRR